MPFPTGRLRPAFAVLATLCLAFPSAYTPAQEPPKSREQEIADLEKQLAELRQKLGELKSDGTLPADWVKALQWRCIGPASMGGRITAISVFEEDPCIYWVATASGGLLKTINAGTTFEHQFDKEATVSIGDVCVAQSNKNIVWVGTGENNPRNSVSYGDGVYKSTDGGKTWTNMGLKKSFQTGKIVIHPKNPEIVYVGALGRLYGPSEERGLYKTTDGGKTWTKILFIDDQTGVIDLIVKPDDPETLIVATWERQRDEFDSHPGNEMPPVEGYDRYDPIKKWGRGSGLHKTTDGGKTWKKLTQGLPSNYLGRIGLDWYRKDPKVVYAIVDCAKIGMGEPPPKVYFGFNGEDAPKDSGGKLTSISDASPASKAGLKTGDIITAVDKKPIKKYRELVEALRGHTAGDKLVLTVQREGKTLEVTVTLENRPLTVDEMFRVVQPFGAFGDPAQGGGLKLTRFYQDSPAAAAGLKDGDIIKAIDKRALPTREAFLEFVQGKKAGDKLVVSYLRGTETKEATVTMRETSPQFGPGGATPTRPFNYMYGGQAANIQAQQGPSGHEFGGIYKSSDAGETWTRINSLNPRPMYFSCIRVDPSDDKFLYVCGVSLHRSSDGGKTFSADGNRGVHPDQHALWVDPEDGRHMIVGCDGGFYVTHDRMQNWDFLNHMAIGQFYHVAVDSKRPYRAIGGLQDNGTWSGPSHSLHGGILNEDWLSIMGGDGFVCRVDPNDPDLVYYEIQDGGMGRRNMRTGQAASIRPQPPKGAPPYRFNWNTPFVLSKHNPAIFYCAGNYVFRSVKRGDDLKAISPEITRTKRGSATALAESPLNPDVLWVGSDDGDLHVTRNGGATWEKIKTVGLPGPRWVASIEPSRFVEGRAYVCFDGHRSNDNNPYVYVTEDFGQTWKPITANLPWGSTRVCREDVANPDLLVVGTEFGAWASLNRGVSWTRINNNLPTVAVHEFAIHPTAGEMVVATHGRSLWVVDVKALRQMTKSAVTAAAHLYEPNTTVRWQPLPARGSGYGVGARVFYGQNPMSGAQIYYSLTKQADKAALTVQDVTGKTVRTLSALRSPGLHRVSWDLRIAPPAAPAGGAAGGPRGPGGFTTGGPLASPGMYRIVLNVDGMEYIQPLKVEADPTLPAGAIAEDQPEPPREDKKNQRIDD